MLLVALTPRGIDYVYLIGYVKTTASMMIMMRYLALVPLVAV